MFSLSNYKVGAAVAVTDMTRARGFYEGVLGLAVETDSGDNVAYRCGDNSVIHVFVSPNAGTAQATVAGWGVDDMDAAVEELGRQGVVFERYTVGPIVTDDRGVAMFEGGNKVAYFKDPDGNVLSIAYEARPTGGPLATGGPLDGASVATRLPAQDIDRARRWYRDKLGLEPSEERQGGLLYRLGAASFAVFASSGKASGDHTQMAFDVADIVRAVTVLQQRGVEFEDVDAPGLHTVGSIADVAGNYPSKGTAERGAWFHDSEGNLLGIGQPVR
jgi:catechol 2,3-dioxygenase-like lactoylglutathione lyase family enzyme